MQLYCKFIGIGITISQSFFVYLALPKLLMLGKTQINLVFRSLNRNFAVCDGEDTPSRQKKETSFFVLRSTFRIFAA